VLKTEGHWSATGLFVPGEIGSTYRRAAQSLGDDLAERGDLYSCTDPTVRL